MEKKVITKEFYVSFDGIHFSNEEECKKHELIFKKISYFEVKHTPDLNETGLYTHITYVAVYSDYVAEAVVTNWAIENFSFLSTGIQGIGFMPSFSIEASTKKRWLECQPILWGGFNLKNKAIFLSPLKVPSMGENIDYFQKWGFKR